MQGFLLSIRVVTPILLMLCVGMLVRRLGWVDEKTLNVMDRLGFKLLLPTQLFYSLYRAEWNVSVYGKPLFASIIIILIILALALLIFGRLEPDPKRRGPVIQCEIRVNFVIFGMAIIASLYGSENTGLIAIMAAIIIPLTSTISAILFEVYRGGRVKPTMLLLNIIKNPYLIGAALGLPVDERMEATGATCVVGIMKGAGIVRVHDVKPIARMCRMTDAILQAD